MKLGHAPGHHWSPDTCGCVYTWLPRADGSSPVLGGHEGDVPDLYLPCARHVNAGGLAFMAGTDENFRKNVALALLADNVDEAVDVMPNPDDPAKPLRVLKTSIEWSYGVDGVLTVRLPGLPLARQQVVRRLLDQQLGVGKTKVI